MIVIKLLLFSGIIPASVACLFLLAAIIGDNMRGLRLPFQVLAFPAAYFVAHWVIVGLPSVWPLDFMGWFVALALLSIIPDVFSGDRGETALSLFSFVVIAGFSLGMVFNNGSPSPWSFWQAVFFGILWVFHFLSSRWFHEYSERIMVWPFFLCIACSFWGLSLTLLMVESWELAQMVGAIVSLLVVGVIVTHRQSLIFTQAFSIHFLILMGFAFFLSAFFVTKVSVVSLLFLMVPVIALPLLEVISVSSRGRQYLIAGGVLGSVLFAILWQAFQF